MVAVDFCCFGSCLFVKKRQEPTRSVKKENTPTRRGIYQQERKIYQQERKIYQEEEKITIRTIIIDISINK